MPMIIDCIDDYFSREKRDLYFIVFGEGRDWRVGLFDNDISKNPPEREELLAWFATHLPATEIKPLFTFGWNSGVISASYDGTVSVDFDEESLAVYCARWETASGDPIDPRFACYWIRFSDYLKKHGGRLPDKPNYDDL
jgi:hypothetical protein